MKIDREDITPETYQAIAEIVIDRLRPLLSDNGRHNTDDTLMTIDETANFLKTSKAQIYQWVNNAQHGLGNFPFYKAGKLLRFTKNGILKWLESR